MILSLLSKSSEGFMQAGLSESSGRPSTEVESASDGTMQVFLARRASVRQVVALWNGPACLSVCEVRSITIPSDGRWPSHLPGRASRCISARLPTALFPLNSQRTHESILTMRRETISHEIENPRFE